MEQPMRGINNNWACWMILNRVVLSKAEVQTTGNDIDNPYIITQLGARLHLCNLYAEKFR